MGGIERIIRGYQHYAIALEHICDVCVLLRTYPRKIPPILSILSDMDSARAKCLRCGLAPRARGRQLVRCADTPCPRCRLRWLRLTRERGNAASGHHTAGFGIGALTGTPVKHALLAAVDRAGGWETVIDRWGDGESWIRISRDFGVSRSFFMRVMGDQPETAEAVSRARARRGEALAERGEETLEGEPQTPAEAAGKNHLARYQLSLAGAYDPMFRESKGSTNVSISLGTLHLDALRQRASIEARATISEPESSISHICDTQLDLLSG